MEAEPVIESKSPATELKERFWKLKRSRIRMVPVHTTRASSIGNDCARFLFYERTASSLRVIHGEETQALFDLGNHVERFVVRELEEMGLEVLERGRDFQNKELEISGHIDAKLLIPGHERPVPAEIKGLNPYTADKIETIADIRDSTSPWVRKYYAQLQTYLDLDGAPMGVFVIMNKVTGQIVFIDCPADPEFQRSIRAKAALVRDAVKSNTPPERNQTSECSRCPFAHVCLPDIDYGAGVQVLDVPELIEAVERRESHREAKKEFDAADRAVKSFLPETAAEILAGNYMLIGKRIDRKAYSVAAGGYIKWDLRQLQTTTTNEEKKDVQ